jgi:molybdopterin converting factor subunit 1
MGTCHVLLFAELAELVGASRLRIDLPPGSTAGDALAALAREHAPIERMRGTLALAVDDAYVRPGAVLHDGQTLALIPPVSGG